MKSVTCWWNGAKNAHGNKQHMVQGRDLRSRSKACEWVRLCILQSSPVTPLIHITDGISKHQGAAIQMSDKKNRGWNTTHAVISGDYNKSLQVPVILRILEFFGQNLIGKYMKIPACKSLPQYDRVAMIQSKTIKYYTWHVLYPMGYRPKFTLNKLHRNS